MESHENSPQLPTIRVLVALGQEDLSIKVCAGTPPAPPPLGPPPSQLVTRGSLSPCVTSCR